MRRGVAGSLIFLVFFWARESESELYHDFEMLHTNLAYICGGCFWVSMGLHYTTLN